MRVEIIKAFSVDTPAGREEYQAGQIVTSGEKNWVEKQLAKELLPETEEPDPSPSDPDAD